MLSLLLWQDDKISGRTLVASLILYPVNKLPSSCTVLLVTILSIFKQQTNKLLNMSKELDLARIIPNEVILVGKLREGKTADISLTADRSIAEVLTQVLETFKFTRDTNPSEAAKMAGFLQGKFFHIQMGDPGGEMITLPNGNKVRRSRKTTKPGFDVIFQASRATTFEEIKLELLDKSRDITRRIELVGGDPNNGKIRLKEFALMGFWDEFSTGFFYTPHFYDPKQSGKLVPLMSHPKQPDGSFSKVGVPAVTNTGRQFVYEDEVHNLDGLRDKFKNGIQESWKVKVSDNTTVPSGALDTGADTVNKGEEKVVAKTTDEP